MSPTPSPAVRAASPAASATPRGKLFFQPTCSPTCRDECAIMREETFGPVAAVARFDSEEEVVARANATEYGLAAYVVYARPATAYAASATRSTMAWSPSTARRSPARRSRSAASSNPASAAKARATASKLHRPQISLRRVGGSMKGTRPMNTPRSPPTNSAAWDRDALLPSLDAYGAARPGRGAEPHHDRRQGVYITDRDGSESLDAFAGLYCVNVGYGRQEIADAIARAGEGARLLPRLCRPRHEPSIALSQDDHRPSAGRA